MTDTELHDLFRTTRPPEPSAAAWERVRARLDEVLPAPAVRRTRPLALAASVALVATGAVAGLLDRRASVALPQPAPAVVAVRPPVPDDVLVMAGPGDVVFFDPIPGLASAPDERPMIAAPRADDEGGR